jgi:hypothetical protein
MRSIFVGLNFHVVLYSLEVEWHILGLATCDVDRDPGRSIVFRFSFGQVCRFIAEGLGRPAAWMGRLRWLGA